MNAPLPRQPGVRVIHPAANAAQPAPEQPRPPDRLAILMELEGELRLARSRDAIGHFMANETRRLLPAAGMVHVFLDRKGKAGFRLTHATGITTPDGRAPAIAALEALVEDAASAHGDATRPFLVETQSPRQADGGCFIAVRLILADGRTGGWMLLWSQKPPAEADLVILDRVAGAYGHALSLYAPSPRAGLLMQNRSRLAAAGLCLAALAMLIPVPLAALAPAEVVARDPFVIAAPLDGVILSVPVEPNSAVRKGTVLLEYDATELAGRRETAARALDVAAARERRARQGAFSSVDMRHELAIAEAERRVAEAELAEADDRLARTKVQAPEGGTLIFSRRDDWIGKPVSTGERIMQIATPGKVQLRIELATGDSGALEGDGRVRFFLDQDPLNPVAASVSNAAHLAETTADNRLVYMVQAQVSVEDEARLRTGLRGTAQVLGPRVPLGFYLFRRPLSALRQRLGL